MAEQTHKRHINDTRTVLPVTLQQPNSSGVNTAVNLTGLTVKFKMVDKYGVDVVSETTTGVTVTTAASGECEYDWSSAGVDTAGKYYAYFTVTDSGESDHFPVESRDLIIQIYGDA